MNRRNIIIAAVGLIVVIFLFNVLGSKKDSDATVSSSHPTAAEAKRLYAEAVALKDSGKLYEAKQLYQQLLTDYAGILNAETVEKELEDINMKIIFTDYPSPDTVAHEVKPGDTLGKLAKKYGTTVELIKKSNALRSDTIRVGQQLRIWIGTFNVLVDKSQNILMLKNDEEIVKVYQVSTGANNSTPIGAFKITTKLVDPVWFNRGVVVPPESPQNVLGSRWLGFDLPGYGIHGTVDPESIGEQITAGCVRLKNSQVEELYSLLPLGTKVVVVD